MDRHASPNAELVLCQMQYVTKRQKDIKHRDRVQAKDRPDRDGHLRIGRIDR